MYGKKVSFTNQNTEKNGYIIFSVDGHVNEFSLEGEPELFQNTENKLYYNGNLEYYAKTKTGKYISSVSNKIEELKDIVTNKFYKKFEEKLYLPIGKEIYGSGKLIENLPSAYFPDSLHVDNTKVDFIPNYNQNYFVSTDFNSSKYTENRCGLTAIMNWLLYYDNNGYPNLLTNNTKNYLQEFEEVGNLVNFDNKG